MIRAGHCERFGGAILSSASTKRRMFKCSVWRWMIVLLLLSVCSAKSFVPFCVIPLSHCISKTGSSGSTTSLVQRFLWDRQSEIGAADTSNNLLQLRFLGGGLGHEVGAAIAVELRTNIASAWVAYVPIHDHRGNVVVLLHRATGAVAEYYRYDAFGNTQIYSPAHSLLPNSALGNPWRFASKRADMETGFVYFGRRFYDPTAGRFVTADPLGFADGPNRYVYVGNRPLVFIDPDGRLAKGAGSGLNLDLYDNNNPSAFINPITLQAGWFPVGSDVSPGTIFSYRVDPAPVNAAIVDIAGKVWTSPNTAVGLVIGTANLPFGGSVSFGNNAIQFQTTYGNPAEGKSALTLGNVVLYSDDASPDECWPRYDSTATVNVGQHEAAHTYQYQVLGPFYAPVYMLSGGAFTKASPWEKAADDYAQGIGSWWPSARTLSSGSNPKSPYVPQQRTTSQIK